MQNSIVTEKNYSEPVLVSVCCITYNHQNFIRETLNGFLLQKTNFPFEIIISDDSSNDETYNIISEFTEKYPGKFQAFLNTENVGMMKNFISTLSSCKGKFIAFCDGDDYWTDENKLQKQLDYIMQHSDCNLVFTDIKMYTQSESQFYPNWASVKLKKYRFEDIVKRNVICTSSALFRNPGAIAIQEWLKPFKIGDWPLYLLILRTGYGFFMNEITTVYRQHAKSAFSLQQPTFLINENLDMLTTSLDLPLLLKEKYHIKKSLLYWKYAKIIRMSVDGNSSEIRAFIFSNVKLVDALYNFPYFIRIIVIFFLPGLKSKELNVSGL